MTALIHRYVLDTLKKLLDNDNKYAIKHKCKTSWIRYFETELKTFKDVNGLVVCFTDQEKYKECMLTLTEYGFYNVPCLSRNKSMSAFPFFDRKLVNENELAVIFILSDSNIFENEANVFFTYEFPKALGFLNTKGTK